jgi:hypothetical protein
MLSKSLTLALTSVFVAASPLFAGSVDEIRSHVNGPVASAFNEMRSLLEKENTQDGKQAADKLKDWMNKLQELFQITESALDGIDPKLKSQWSDLYRLEKDVQVMAGVVQSEIGKSSYKSDLSELKSRWEKFASEVNKVYASFVEYGKTTAKFQNLCSSCR